ncbi:xin actin-binding repeat-containing protein 1 [Polymixia lowei]
MEWKSSLRRTQSLKSVSSSCAKPVWAEVGLSERKASVSQLVARYQTTVELAPHNTTTPSPRPLESKQESKLESLLRKDDEKEWPRGKTNLARSKSMGSLPNSAGGIGSLKALFESKAGSPYQVRSSLPPRSTADSRSLVTGEVEEKVSPAKKEAIVPAARLAAAAKGDEVTLKVVNKTRVERRKTIGGIDFEKVTASQVDDKRRTIADFRDSSFIQAKEKSLVSVKAMSALYLSKVAAAEPIGSPLRSMTEDSQQTKDDRLPPPLATLQAGAGDISGTRSRPAAPSQPSKAMLHQQRQKCELRRLLKHTHPELKTLDGLMDEELAEVLSSDGGLTAAETGYEGEVFSRRWIFENLSNKEEPHAPKMLLAEGTAKGGDVKRASALFEQPWEKLHNEEDKTIVEVSKRPTSSPDPSEEREEEMVRVDVQSARRMFESQSVDTSRSSPDDKFEGKVQDETGAVKKQQPEIEMCSTQDLRSENKSSACIKSLDLTEQSYKQGPCVHVVGLSSEHEFSENQQHGKTDPTVEAARENESTSLPNPGDFGETIRTSAALFQNNPFISTNIERAQPQGHGAKAQHNTTPSCDPVVDSRVTEDTLMANVKNRAQLFESMPFDKIRHQNKEEMETMVENINETLSSLYHFNAIHSNGSIIEVNETMKAKKAKYMLTQSGPEIRCNEVAEGGAQNFILQLVPRANLKPQVTYLKEDNQGNVEATIVDVPLHQFSVKQDVEFKTANVVQLIEDMLYQDNSLTKGVIIQEDANRGAEVTVYSLYNYAEGDVKSYCPPQRRAEPDEPERIAGDGIKTDIRDVRKGDVKSTINCLLTTTQDQSCPGSIRPEETIKGNVKLFRSCIERGDLEYLKTLQAEPTEQELPPSQNSTPARGSVETCHEQDCGQVEESTSEWAPVDVKRLKNLFSAGRPVQPKQAVHGDLVHNAKLSPGPACQSKTLGQTESSTEHDNRVFSHVQGKNNSSKCGGQEQEKESDFNVSPQGSYPCFHTQGHDMVHQAELVEVVDDEDEISNLQAAINSLQSTVDAKGFHVTQDNHQLTGSGISERHVASIIKCDVKTVVDHEVEAGLPQENIQKDTTCSGAMLKPTPSASSVTSEHKSESQQENMEKSFADIDPEEEQTTEACGSEGQQGTEVVQKGHLKAAIMSLQSSVASKQDLQQEDKENVVQGNIQAALDSLGRSSINITRGDFRAAMIYRNSSKSHKEKCKNVDADSVQKPTEEEGPSTKSESTPCETFSHVGQVAPEELSAAKPPSPGQTPNKPARGAPSGRNRRTVGPKPAIPPKPEYLRVKQTDHQLTNTEHPIEATQTSTVTEMKNQSKGEQPLQTLPTASMPYILNKGLSDRDSPKDSKPGLLDSEKHEANELAVETIQMSQKILINHQDESSKVTSGREISDNSILVEENTVSQPEEMNVNAEEEYPQNYSVKGNGNEADESHVNFHEACQRFGGKTEASVKIAPIKPKRVRIPQSEYKNLKHIPEDDNSTILTHLDVEAQQRITGPSCSKPNTHEQIFDNNTKQKKGMKQETKVVMRQKKVKMETEDERRQRLSVHMDEIMRGNITAAMEIFDNLRKQEELQNILTKVEEIEQDTSNVDVRSLRTVFENVPAWVVTPKPKKQKQAKVEHKVERPPSGKDDAESVSSMAHVFGDLERASEEIMNLKEQTLARLMDIEEAIKKALYSVSTLKSDSDIAGLSGLFRESLGTVQGSPLPGNIRKISIGSSRTKTPQAHESPATRRDTDLPVDQITGLEVPSAKPRASPPSSPAFISIQTTARNKDKAQVQPPETTTCPTCQQSPKTEEKFRTTKTLKCGTPAQYMKRDPRKGGQKQSSDSPNSPLNLKRELSVLEVQTDPKGNSILGTRTVKENYERTDDIGNQFYSSTTSTVVTTQPETMILSRGPVMTSPAAYQVTTYPEVRLPINKKP